MMSLVDTNLPWDYIITASAVSLLSIGGIVLTLLTLPGMWIAIAAGVVANFVVPGMFSWWTIGACVALAGVAELLELLASAFGAAKGGASKKGAIAAVIGALIGAIAGSFFIPPIGTVVGAASGAGIGAIWAEIALNQRDFTTAAKAGAGAAIGRLIAMLLKTTFACAVAGVLVTAAWYS